MPIYSYRKNRLLRSHPAGNFGKSLHWTSRYGTVQRAPARSWNRLADSHRDL